MGESVLRSRHCHESHAEMFAHVTPFVASPYFSTYAELWFPANKVGLTEHLPSLLVTTGGPGVPSHS